MRKVDSYEQFKKEKKRLLEKQALLEAVLKKDLNELKEEIDKSLLFTKEEKNSTLTKSDSIIDGAGLLSDLLVTKVFFRKSGFITRFAASSIARNFTASILEKKKPLILSVAKSIFKKIKKKIITLRKK